MIKSATIIQVYGPGTQYRPSLPAVVSAPVEEVPDLPALMALLNSLELPGGIYWAIGTDAAGVLDGIAPIAVRVTDNAVRKLQDQVAALTQQQAISAAVQRAVEEERQAAAKREAALHGEIRTLERKLADTERRLNSPSYQRREVELEIAKAEADVARAEAQARIAKLQAGTGDADDEKWVFDLLKQFAPEVVGAILAPRGGPSPGASSSPPSAPPTWIGD